MTKQKNYFTLHLFQNYLDMEYMWYFIIIATTAVAVGLVSQLGCMLLKSKRLNARLYVAAFWCGVDFCLTVLFSYLLLFTKTNISLYPYLWCAYASLFVFAFLAGAFLWSLEIVGSPDRHQPVSKVENFHC